MHRRILALCLAFALLLGSAPVASVQAGSDLSSYNVAARPPDRGRGAAQKATPATPATKGEKGAPAQPATPAEPATKDTQKTPAKKETPAQPAELPEKKPPPKASPVGKEKGKAVETPKPKKKVAVPPPRVGQGAERHSRRTLQQAQRVQRQLELRGLRTLRSTVRERRPTERHRPVVRPRSTPMRGRAPESPSVVRRSRAVPERRAVGRRPERRMTMRERALARAQERAERRGLSMAAVRSARAPARAFESTMREGATGDGVHRLQGFLKQFPDLYPEGLETGNYGLLTSAAVRRLQGALGLGQDGAVSGDTLAKLNELHKAVERKQPPKIESASPAVVPEGGEVTLSGRGFTIEGNGIFVKGKTILSGLLSVDGTTLTFALPEDIPCTVGPACPIKVVNGNGISNALPIRLTAAVPEPTPEPEPEPEPTPAPSITSITPSMGLPGTEVTLAGSDFTAANNAVNIAGVDGVVTGLASADGLSLSFPFPSDTSCVVLQPCALSVTNAYGTSNEISFTVTQVVTDVVVVAPNGGERFVQGERNAIRWSGGTDRVHIALLHEAAVPGTDPTDSILGWLSTSGLPDGSLTWDGRKACSLDSATCWDVSSGFYKILAVSENEWGELAIWPGNTDMSDGSFQLLSAPSLTVVSPNGGEAYKLGDTVTISWEAKNIASKSVNILLLKAGKFAETIASNVALSEQSGLFVHSWAIPSTLAAGTDYTVEIADTDNTALSDRSDASFSIVAEAGNTITVRSPNGGETWIRGMKGAVWWDAETADPVTVNLFKGGTFFRTIATNVYGKYFDGYWFQKLFSWPTRYALLSIPDDIPEGTDYAVQLVSEGEPGLDTSNAPFAVVPLPSPVTFGGRFLDRFTGQPLAHTQFFNDADRSVGRQTVETDENGVFSFSAPIDDLAEGGAKVLFGAFPSCYIAMGAGLANFHLTVYTVYDEFDLMRSSSIFPIYSSALDLGEIRFWPAVAITISSDIPVRFWVRYPEESKSTGSQQLETYHRALNLIPLDYDAHVELIDEAGNIYQAPTLRLSRDHGCEGVTLEFTNGQFTWK